MASAGEDRRLAPLCRLLVLAALVALPIRVLGHGFLPSDDALRHAAKVVSGRPWSEILLLREGAPFDLHPGWHAFLSAVRALTGWDAHALVLFSVVFAFAAFALPWALRLARPEAVLLAFLVLNLMDPHSFARLLFGRPFLATAAALNALLLALPELQESSPMPRRTLAGLTLVVGLAVWVHPSFYLWALPILACVLARQFRAAARAALVVAAGAFLGGALAGRPLGLLLENLAHGWTTATLSSPAGLVGELRPHLPPPSIEALVAVLLLLRVVRGRPVRAVVDTPVGWLAALGWLLGFVAGRFWFDFGMVALIHFVAREIGEALSTPAGGARRVGLAAVASAAFLLVIGADTNDRWARPQDLKWAVLFQPANPRALPEPGGILFADSMDFFFQGFYRQPRAPWRYAVGFEQSLMPPEDREIFRELMARRPLRPAQVFEPWIRRMRPQDRLLLETTGPQDPPPLSGLEWTFVPPTFWSGGKAGAP
jgi:hypothetical protein